MIFYGRSDAILNPGGVRIGTAEIYRQVEREGDILSSVAIGYRPDGNEVVILFVKLKEGAELSDELVTRLRKNLKEEASPRHVPAQIISVPDIPITKSGKLSEITVRRLLHGEEIENISALANPESLQFYRELEL